MLILGQTDTYEEVAFARHSNIKDDITLDSLGNVTLRRQEIWTK